MTGVMDACLQPGHDEDMESAALRPALRIRPIALPSEHGGWGMMGAPILAGLLLAPSWAGALIGVAGLAAFLTRQPLRLALTDLRKGKRYPRTRVAAGFACAYGALGLIAIMFAAMTAHHPFWAPLALALGLGAVQFREDLGGRGRRFLPEALGASAMALLAAAIALAGGLDLARAGAAALVLALQAATAITYAGARVRLERGVEIRGWPCALGHAVGLSAVSTLAAAGLVPVAVVAAFGALVARAVWGLSGMRAPVKASVVGLQELGYALATVLCLSL